MNKAEQSVGERVGSQETGQQAVIDQIKGAVKESWTMPRTTRKAKLRVFGITISRS
jgi:hypothetical protein